IRVHRFSYCSSPFSSRRVVTSAFRELIAEQYLSAERSTARCAIFAFTSPLILTVRSTFVKLLGSVSLLSPSISISMDSIFRSEEHTSELQSRFDLVCRLLLVKKHHNRLLHHWIPRSALQTYFY